MSGGVALINPKFPRNLGNVLRACSNFKVTHFAWTDERIPHPDDWPPGERLPREERMKLYKDVLIQTYPKEEIIKKSTAFGFIPVAVEVSESAIPLPLFEHPKHALYIFGPEDGTLDRAILKACYHFVVIPSISCLNLAAAVNVVLYDRLAKSQDYPNPALTRAYQEVEA